MRRWTMALLAGVVAACNAGGDRAAERSDATQVSGYAGKAAPASEPTAVMSDEAARVAPAPPPTPAPDAPPQAAADSAPAAPVGQAAPSMVIRTGYATIEVDSLEPAVARVRELAARVGGFVANTSVQTGRNEMRSATLELKIPAARWDEAVRALRPIGTVESVSESAQDVGEEYVDLQARLANSRRLEERLVELLARRTGKLEDVLAVERELARVREAIERHEGRLRYLRTRVSLSTLTITVHEPGPLVGVPGDEPIADAFRQAWRNFVGFVAWFIGALGWMIPVAVLVGLVLWAVRRFGWRRPPRSGHIPPPVSPPPAP